MIKSSPCLACSPRVPEDFLFGDVRYKIQCYVLTGDNRADATPAQILHFFKMHLLSTTNTTLTIRSRRLHAPSHQRDEGRRVLYALNDTLTVSEHEIVIMLKRPERNLRFYPHAP
ncbi:hypothetical protein Q7C36_011198 [Tachysurus vachellii]|uniref:Uncharacterized protein n=1 Tax=Tachysurus vachellii TaxID=175792 RepID=A0AA88MT40_TACVA|nr:hypothetical protein Q7C36_011198 [Tachysurus vachellii]